MLHSFNTTFMDVQRQAHRTIVPNASSHMIIVCASLAIFPSIYLSLPALGEPAVDTYFLFIAISCGNLYNICVRQIVQVKVEDDFSFRSILIASLRY